MDKRQPTPKDPLAHARKQLGNPYGELAKVQKQIIAVKTAAGDDRGESFGLLVARLDEAAERLRELVERQRQIIAAGAALPDDEDDEATEIGR